MTAGARVVRSRGGPGRGDGSVDGGGARREAPAVRTLVAWCPDWPVLAAVLAGEVPAGLPLAVVRGNRVVACSEGASAEGVRRGMRRREAQARCPDLELVVDDPARDARAFEPVVAALERFTPLVEIVRPGLCQFATRGPSRYFGGDEALAAGVVAAAREAGVACRVGVADGPFAAALAARSPAGEEAAVVVPPGGTPAFLAPFPVGALAAAWGGAPGASVAVTGAGARRGRGASRGAAGARREPSDPAEVAELVELLGRLGLRTLAAFGALPPSDVVARFGTLGARAHRLARGLDDRAPHGRVPPPDLVAAAELDPPADRVELVVFTAKALAEELHDRLAGHGLTCTRIRIEAETERGESLARLWRHERAGAAGGLTAAALADRVRWQLDGWLRAGPSRSGGAPARPSAPLTLLRLVPDEVVPDDGRQLGLWGGASAADERAARGFARLQGLFGPDAVAVPVAAGGRSPAELVRLVPWGDDRGDDRGDGAGRPGRARSGAARSGGARSRSAGPAAPPWPGRLPPPLPAQVHEPPRPAGVADRHGRPVAVTGRGLVSDAPAVLTLDRGTPQPVVGWAGPWPVDERWWDLEAHRRRARFQLVTADGAAYLAVLEAGVWWVEASYG